MHHFRLLILGTDGQSYTSPVLMLQKMEAYSKRRKQDIKHVCYHVNLSPWRVIPAECVTCHVYAPWNSCLALLSPCPQFPVKWCRSAEHQLWNATLLHLPGQEEILPGELRNFLAAQYDSHT